MIIFAIGDVVGQLGCNHLRKVLATFKRENKVDLVIANGENSHQGNGVSQDSADFLFDSGVNIITTGNHAFRYRNSYQYYDTNPFIIRPANYPTDKTPGKGMCIYDMGRIQVAVINILGTAFLDNLNCPFKTVDEYIKKADDFGAKIKIVDFHAEATAEKKAMGYYLDGKVSAVFGTHTHVLTADEDILPNGTAYITDIGMTGVTHSVLGVDSKIAIERFITKMPLKFEEATGKCKLTGILMDIDETTRKAKTIKRIEL